MAICQIIWIKARIGKQIAGVPMQEAQEITNKLIHESSPYLLQHAHNPVDWYPWGDQAFQKAEEEDKPIFLSIGYSTCHWCHVMAHESFEDEKVADVLNSHFISIKVDREQRPDIDQVYMSACQAMTGSGGWPLSIFMTADKKPFFAGTYFPKQDAYGKTGFIELSAQIARLWATDRQNLLKNSALISDHLSEQNRRSDTPTNVQALIDDCYAILRDSFESEFGGFSHSPKFPAPHNVLFLLKYYKAYDDAPALHMAEHTLIHMHRGGLYDHVGGGFSRYSVDREWLVPHFEKMLYDNALLLLAYSEALSATKNKAYRPIIDGIANYILRDMRSKYGDFYSAEDADSEGKEGKFYVFGYQELEQELSAAEMRWLENNYGVSQKGNFEGNNILHITGSAQDSDQILQKLFALRSTRPRPFKDTKRSVSWNGLMIEALCRAGEVTGNQDYIERAQAAADFILAKAQENEELYGTYKEGTKPTQAFLADYANFANSLIELYSATLELDYLQQAQSLASRMIALFWDDEDRRFYMTRKGDDELFIRPTDEYDGALPSGSSRAIECLGRLARLTGDSDFSHMFEKAVKEFTGIAADMPGAYNHFVSTLFAQIIPFRQIIITAKKDNEQARQVYKHLQKEYLPFTTLLFYDRSVEAKQVFPRLTAYDPFQSFAAYVCENFACQSPLYDPEELLKQLGLEA